MTKETLYNKLVRDNIPEIIEKAGKRYQIHVADGWEYGELLCEKLKEELAEFNKEPSDGEAADILEVIYSLFAFHGLALADIEKVRNEKLLERGGFSKRLILEKVIG